MAATSLLTAAATTGSRHSIQSNGSNHSRFITNLHNYDYLNNNGRHSLEVVDNAPAMAARRSCSFPRSNRSSTSDVVPQQRSTSIGARIKKFFKNALSRPKVQVAQEVEIVTSEESSVSNTPQQTHTPMSISDGTPLSSTSSSRATLSTPATPQKKISSTSIPGIALLPSSPVIPGKRLRPPPSQEDIAKSKSLPANTKPPSHPYDGGGPSKAPSSKSKSAKTLSPDAKSQSPRSRLPKLKSLSPLLIKTKLLREDRERTRSRSSTSSLSDCNTSPSSPAPSSCSASSSGTRSHQPTSSVSSTSSQCTTRIPRPAQKCANFGPADYNYDETISTLRYANRAKNIKNKAKINEDPKDALLRQFQKEIEDLKKQLEEGGLEMGDDESGSEEDSDEEGGGGGTTGKRRKKKGKKGLSKEKMAAIQQQIEADRKKLEEQKDMEEEEKKKIEDDLESKESELKKAQEEQEALQHKLAAIEKKIIVGGENLLEKAEEQERLLEESAKELEARRRKEEELRKQLAEKEQERLDIEEKYSNLQEEVAGKTKKLKKVWTMLMQAKSEMADLQQEHQREMEGLLENVRQLSRELHLQMLIIDSFIPPEYQEMIEQYVHWNEDIGEWQLKCVAYTGNNMRKQSPVPDKDKERFHEPDLSHVYLAYTAEGAEQALRPKASKSKTGRPKTANRPKTSKKKSRKDQDMDNLLQ